MTPSGGFADYLALLRATLPALVPSRYRGIQRAPIDRWWEGERTGVVQPNDRARRRIWELFGPDPCLLWSQPPWFDPDLLPAFEVAREILLLTDVPSDYEILHVTRGECLATAQTLGFDVGYWGSDHYSVIADAMITPRWHGCPPEQLQALQPWARRLNEHLLFRTADDAMEYRRWYVRQPWAETEADPGELQVIRADTAP